MSITRVIAGYTLTVAESDKLFFVRAESRDCIYEGLTDFQPVGAGGLGEIDRYLDYLLADEKLSREVVITEASSGVLYVELPLPFNAGDISFELKKLSNAVELFDRIEILSAQNSKLACANEFLDERIKSLEVENSELKKELTRIDKELVQRNEKLEQEVASIRELIPRDDTVVFYIGYIEYIITDGYVKAYAITGDDEICAVVIKWLRNHVEIEKPKIISVAREGAYWIISGTSLCIRTYAKIFQEINYEPVEILVDARGGGIFRCRRSARPVTIEKLRNSATFGKIEAWFGISPYSHIRKRGARYCGWVQESKEDSIMLLCHEMK